MAATTTSTVTAAALKPDSCLLRVNVSPMVGSSARGSVSRAAFLFLAACICLVLMLVSGRSLLAELYAIPARHVLTLENSSVWRERDSVYANALQSISNAQSFVGDNPEYHEIKSRLHIDRCRYWDVVEQWQEWQVCQQQSLEQVRAQLLQNPQWPYVWANLLLVKYNLRQFDEEFYRALQKCQALGSRELAVNRVVAYVGLKEWVRWPIAQQEQFRQALLTVQKVAPEHAKAIADETRRSFLYCYWTNADPHQHYSCRKKNRKSVGRLAK
jgi:hypothetical protein